MKNNFFLPVAFILISLSFQSCKDDNNEIIIKAGSVNAIAGAISMVDVGGTVRLAAGIHTENSRILIDKKISLIGEPGAVLVSNTIPTTDTNDIELRTAVHILNAPGTFIDGIEFRSSNTNGGTALLMELSDDVTVKNCKMVHHQFSIVIEMSNRIIVSGNEMSGILDAFSGGQLGFFATHGIIVVNGKQAQIIDNKVSNCVFGAWLCDEGGFFEENTTSGNLIGAIGCVVPKKAVGALPRNPIPYTLRTCKGWTIRNNKSNNNIWSGYALADGSNNNTCENNEGGDNGYDYELFGDTYFFAPPQRPKCHDNQVKIGSFQNLTVLDCGDNNQIITGIQPYIAVPIDSCR